MTDHTEDREEQTQLRRQKLGQWRAQGEAYPNDFKRRDHCGVLVKQCETLDNEALEVEAFKEVCIAGRMMTRRLMGKTAFIDIQDGTGRLQVYLKAQALPEGLFEAVKKWDLGDILGITGKMFRTKTGELSVKAASLRLLVKSLHPLPDKFHGLSDQEMCYRKRYLDLLVNQDTRERFLMRTRIIQFIREFLLESHFLEVETPMMHPIPGGAAARPFKTHHHALDRELYLRIAPELYLKRLVVGGFERVFEINRNFRNEGVSTRHNPEFTMVEFYSAYWDYQILMQFTEQLLQALTQTLFGETTVAYQGKTIDFGKPFVRMTMVEALLSVHPELTEAIAQDKEALLAFAKQKKVELDGAVGLGAVQTAFFEETVEHRLLQPTFIYAYPREVSPLARCNDTQPDITDRFELFIMGREIANGFSELNDPEDQAERFRLQAEAMAAGDNEAMHYDADYINALEYGLPPTAGEGIGIDRLVMLLTDAPSIKDVILFPQLRSLE